MRIKLILLVVLTTIFQSYSKSSADVFIEAESFSEKGGWVVDQQFMDQMGSPYLMAHGLGKVVADAHTTVEFPETGTYRLWVRTFNWTAPWYKGAGPGQFKLKVNGKVHPVVLGNTGEQWMWQDAGKVSVKNEQTQIALQDLTGFNGRCDALLFTKDESFVPPSDLDSLSEFRRNRLGIEVQNTKHYDLVVVGGGIAGICAAVSAGRLGLTVALINNRPVLGGNNSSEIRVSLINDLPIYGGNHGSIPFGLSGDNDFNLYPNLGNVMREIAVKMERHYYNAGPPEAYLDDEKLAMVKQTPNVDLYLNMHVFKTEMSQNTIKAVVARHIENSAELRFEGSCFADCTGDATVGYLAGADYRMGREGTYEALETLAPTVADNAMTGTSNLWRYETFDTPSTFPVLDWACQMNPDFYVEADRDWRWEGGFSKNTITEAENIRDQNFRAIFGNWSYVKNNLPKFANRQISWLAYIAGKRESRRLLGDIILNQNDIQNQVKYDDASFTTTWPLDLHYPDPKNSKYFQGEEFFSYCVKTYIAPYHVPYRCLYSRNINNLFMAGRNISVTHVAFGTIRIQQQTGMMGEVVGIAASLCKKYNIVPRQVYTEHLADLKSLFKTGVPTTMVNVAKNKPVRYSDVSLTDNTSQMPAFGVKFGNTPRWVSNDSNTEHWMEIDLQGTYAVNACKIWRENNVKQFRLQAKVNGAWVDVVSEDNDHKADYYKEFKSVSTDKVRFYVPAYANNRVRLSNIEVYSINPLNK